MWMMNKRWTLGLEYVVCGGVHVSVCVCARRDPCLEGMDYKHGLWSQKFRHSYSLVIWAWEHHFACLWGFILSYVTWGSSSVLILLWKLSGIMNTKYLTPTWTWSTVHDGRGSGLLLLLSVCRRESLCDTRCGRFSPATTRMRWKHCSRARQFLGSRKLQPQPDCPLF